MLHIIPTIDYEIFGDGSGDVRKHIIEPTERILKICDNYSIPLTIMFEVNEYKKFIEYESELLKDLGYSPAQKIKKQLMDAYRKGHDVQLHIHPQWINAKYGNGKWMMENPLLSIVEFSALEIDRIFNEAKAVLENIMQEVNQEYSVSIMRHTNLPWVEAPVKVHDAMLKNNIFYHSLATSDSKKNNRKGIWNIDRSGKLFEIPIHSVTYSGYKRFSWNRIKTALYRKMYTNDSMNDQYNNNQQKKEFFNKFIKICFDQCPLKWDFCKQNSKEMIKFLDIALLRYDYQNDDVPLIMIGHSKDFFNTANLNKFFGIVNKDYDSGKIIFSTFPQYLKQKNKVKNSGKIR